MADERVVIKIEVNSDDRAIDRTRRKLERLARSESKTRRRTDRDNNLASRGRDRMLRNDTRSLDKVMRQYKKSFDSFDKMIRFTGAGLMKFIGLSAKMVALEMAAMGAAMVGVHLIFGAGRLIMKAYQGAMKFVAGGMAGLAIAAGTVAAALREQQAAMYAFSSKGQAKEFGSAVNQARVQVRSLTMDAELAAVGVENLMAAYGEVAKSGQFTAASKNTLKGLMDFASAGMDLKKGTAEAGKFIATLQDTKKSYSEVVTAGKQFSPQLKKALEEYEKGAGAKGKTKEALTKAIQSGELSKLGGVEGQFAGVSGTLINTIKAQFNLLRGLFADFGQQFLEPVKKEAKEIFYIIKTALNQMNSQVSEFGRGGFIDKASDLVQKIADWTVRVMRDYLPGTMGLFQRIGAWWDRFVSGWNKILDYLRPFIEGAKVVEGILKNVWLPIWDQIKNKMYEFNNELQRYEPLLLEFGTKIGELVAKIMEYGSEVRKIFLDSLPFINKVIKGLTDLIELFTSFLGKFTQVTSKLPGGLGSMGSVMMLIGLARGMKNTKGYFTNKFSQSGIREVANMNVRAGVIYVNGQPMAQYGAGVRGGSGGIVSGSNTINTGPRGAFVGPFRGPAGGAGGGAGGGFASSGTGRGTFVKTQYGRGQAGMGPNGGTLITSGPHKGKEILTQRVQGKNVQYLMGERGKGPIDRSQFALTGRSYQSGVHVDAADRMSGNKKIVTASGRIISRRERAVRYVAEGQRLGATGYQVDPRAKKFADRMFGGNQGARGLLGRAADRYRNRLVRRSDYLGPGGPGVGGAPPPGVSPEELRRQGWLLTSKKAYGPGTYDPNGLRARYYNSRMYNNWLSPTSQENGPLQPGRGPLGKMRGLYQGARVGSRNMRASRLGSSVFGNEAAGKKGFQGSATGTMGTMIGLGLLSNYASEEAQGFLSAGSMVGMINPLAGLAIGLGGTALTAKTEKGGAMAGAGAGAAIGTYIAPGFGTVAGAIIGAAVGGLMGRANRIKEEKKQARQIMEGVFDQLIKGSLRDIQRQMISQGFVGKSAIAANAQAMVGKIGKVSELQSQFGNDNAGFVEALYSKRGAFGLDMTNEDRQKMLKQPQETAKAVGKAVDKQDAMNKLTGIYQKRLDELTRMTGKSEQEVEKMAMELGVNLYDATTDFNVVLEKLGVTVKKTREQMRGMQIDLALRGLQQFEERIKELDTPEILDEQARAFRDMVDAAKEGFPEEKDMAEFIKDFMPNFINFVGGGLQGLISARTSFGAGGTAFSQEDGPFEGLENLFTTGPFGQMFQEYLSGGVQSGAKLLGGDLNSILLNTGADQRFQVDSQKFGEVLAGMESGAAMRLTTAIQDGTLFADYDMKNLTAAQIIEAFGKFGVGGAEIGLREMAENDELNLKLDQMPDEIKKTYEGIIAMFGEFFNKRDERPDWMTAEFIKLAYDNMTKDTYSPRGKSIGDTTSSRLSQTMARHSSMDGMLTGKRTMTSAYRTHGLGSINSDHVTGRAYDLVGQNLGGYAKLVHANGGFAEFHGTNAGRHLHVVPGPGAYGEATPRIAQRSMPVSGSSSSGDIYITQNIQAGPNATPTEVAKIAVREMRLALENERQRA